jgi:hypothetical protein
MLMHPRARLVDKLLAVGFVLACLVPPAAHSQQAALTVHTAPARVEHQGFVAAVSVKPTSAPAKIARALAIRPVGQRSILLEGFADDLVAADFVTVPAVKDRRGRTVRPALRHPAPWMDAGAARARSRTTAWLASYRSVGGPPIDLVMIRCRATMAWSAFFPRTTLAGWSAAARDARFSSLASTIGVPSLQSAIFSSPVARAAWDKYFEHAVDAQIRSAVGDAFSQEFPAAIVCSEGRYRAPAGQRTIKARNGLSGVPQQVGFSLAGHAAPGFSVLGAMTSELARVRGAGIAVPTLAAFGSPSWRGTSAAASLPIALQSEVFAQFAAAGYRHVWSESAGWASGGARSIADTVVEANTKLGGGVPSRSASEPAFDAARLQVGGAVRNGTTTWRVSMAPGVNGAIATFADGGTLTVARGGAGSGGWLSHPESRRLVSVAPEQTTAPSSGGFMLLTDDLPSTQSTMSPAAVRYMIVYQGVDPQSYSSARMDIAKVIAGVHAEFAAGRGSSWGVLDFEDPFNEIMDHGPSDPRWSSAIGSLVETIRAVKAAFPAVRWTYYNFPRVGYWNFERDWSSLSETQRDAVYAAALSRYAPLMEELDWFMPSIYDRYERAGLEPAMRDFFVVAERSFRSASVEFLRRYMTEPGRSRRPIIPMASPWFIEGGRAPQWRAIPTDELVADQIAPTIAAGADGIALWCVKGWLATIATRDGSLFSEYSRQEQARFRAQFALDRLGGPVAPGFNWSSPTTVALVQSHLTAAVNGAASAVQQEWLRQQSAGQLGGSTSIAFARP